MKGKGIMTAETKKQLFFYGWWMVFVAFMCMLVAYGARFYSFGIYLKPMSQEMGWSRATTAGAFTVSTLFMGFLSPICGKLLDKYGTRVIMLWGGIIAGIGFALCYFTQSLLHFYIFFSLIMPIGIVGTGAVPSNGLVVKWFNKKRGTALGAVSVGMGLGSFIMVNLAQFLIAQYGWRTSFLIMGVLIWIVVCPLAVLLVKDKPQDLGLLPDGDEPLANQATSVGSAAAMGDVWPMKDFLRTWAFWATALMFALSCFGLMINLVHLVPHATDIGHSRTFSAFVLSIMMICGLIGRFGFGYIADKIKISPMMLMSGALFVMSIAMFVFLVGIGIKSNTSFYAYVVIYGLPYGAMTTLTAVIVGRLFGPASYGIVYGAVYFVATFGTGFGPLFAGWIFDVTKSYDIAFITGAALTLISAALIATAKPPKRKKA